MILHVLSEGPVRFNEIRRQLMGINHATLSRQLKKMESDGLVKRTEYEGRCSASTTSSPASGSASFRFLMT